MKKSITYSAAFISFFIVFFLSIAHFITTRSLINRIREDNKILTSEIYNSLAAYITDAVIIAKSMANDYYLIENLKKESFHTEEENIALFSQYLEHVKEPFSYAFACIISDQSRRYYRNDGLLKIVSPETDASDAWYPHFLAGDRRYTATVWRNPDNEEDSLLFINYAIQDHDHILGVVSASLYIRDILAKIAEYEKLYNIRVNFTDATGLVQIDRNYRDIGTASLAHLVLSQNSETETTFKKLGASGFAAVKWIPELSWYFVVRNTHKTVSFIYMNWFYLLSIVLFIIAVCLLFTLRKYFHAPRAVFPGQKKHVDVLTGLPNRNFFKDMYGERGVFNTTRYVSLAVFDIDFFKEANDNMNGDDVLVSVVKHMLALLKDNGLVLRWGGDEFLVLFELPIDNAYKLCRQFCKDVAQDALVTVSVGLTTIRLADTIKKNYYRAAQLCYQVKEVGGNGVIKG